MINCKTELSIECDCGCESSLTVDSFDCWPEGWLTIRSDDSGVERLALSEGGSIGGLWMGEIHLATRECAARFFDKIVNPEVAK